MAVTECPPAWQTPRDAEAMLTELQERAAETATTVGEFAQNWKQEIRKLMGTENAGTDGARSLEDWQAEVEKRTNEIDRAAKGNESLRLGKLGPQTGGQNTIGGGKGGILLNQSLAAELGTAHTAEDLRIAAAHENVHGRSVQLHGTLRDETGKRVDPLEIHEGFAEAVSMEEEGGGMEQWRVDQPQEVYGRGQTLVLRIIQNQKAGREALEKTLMGDGDLNRLQPAFSRN
ncbi:MAG: hypothetical protein V1876_00270 [Candidatus Peregrinibacteria bacterium]